MRYDRNAILKSERAYQILRQLSINEDGSYPTQISEKIGANRSAVSEIISQLNELELIEKKERDSRAQYYQINWDGFYRFWIDLLNESYDKSVESLEGLYERDLDDNLKPEFNKYVEKEPKISEIKEDKNSERGLIARFFLNYSTHYFEYFEEDKTLENMLITDVPKAVEDGFELTSLIKPKIEEQEGEKELAEHIATMMEFLELSTPGVPENPGARAFTKEFLKISEEELNEAEEKEESSVEDQ